MIVRKIVGAVLALVLLAQLQGCGTHSWREDVKLGDGRIINVKRVEKYTGWGGIGSGCRYCRFRHARLFFEFNGSTIEWISTPMAQEPMILDISQGIPVVVSFTATADCPKHLSGDQSYNFFVYSTYQNGEWVQSATSPFPILQRRNLHRYRPDRRSDLTIEAKDKVIDEIIRKKWVMDYQFYLIVDGAEKICRPWMGLEDRK